MTPKTPQEILQELKYEPPPTVWDYAPNKWIKALSSGDLGRIAENLVATLVNGRPTKNSTVGYDIDANEKRIEVKAASVSISNGYPVLSWKGIRGNDPYTHIGFVAFYTDNTRVFLVPRESIPAESLSPMNTSRTAEFAGAMNHQIHIRKIHNLPVWLTDHEIKCVVNLS